MRQLVHVLAAEADWNVPAAHCVHAVVKVVLQRPGAQTVHAVHPGLDVKVPAAHWRHASAVLIPCELL